LFFQKAMIWTSSYLNLYHLAREFTVFINILASIMLSIDPFERRYVAGA
jgi:hypothetical protein